MSEHGTFAAIGRKGSIEQSERDGKRCDCPDCTQQRLLFCEVAEAGQGLPQPTAPTTFRLQ